MPQSITAIQMAPHIAKSTASDFNMLPYHVVRTKVHKTLSPGF